MESRPQSRHVLCPQCLSPSFDNHVYLPIPHQSFLSVAHWVLGGGESYNSVSIFPPKTLVTHLIVKPKHELEAFQKGFVLVAPSPINLTQTRVMWEAKPQFKNYPYQIGLGKSGGGYFLD